MTTDYEEFLRVTEDGRIWWLRKDAIRLGAGFLPVCDDNRQLEPKLQAHNQSTLLNERTLIGALGDTRLNIPMPTAFERDGFCYVDAAEFLEWLSQYICLSQSEIEFPNELASRVRIAMSKAAAERRPQGPKPFESLTLALEGWFDKHLDALPAAVRQRVEREFSPMPWDSLIGDARRSVALQLDYQRDPATEADRKYWWDFFVRMHEVQAQIKEWEGAKTPTATDKLLKESRLKELRLEHERLKRQQRQARGEYFPGHVSLAAPNVLSPTDDDFIAYPKAMRTLADRLNATAEELATWIFLGPDTGGIAAYLNANELNPPPRFHFDVSMGEDYVSPLMACWFRRSDIERFTPENRFITGEKLIERWGRLHGIRAEAFIRAKIAESRLLDLHPTFGGTQGTFSEKDGFPPLSAGMFALSLVKQIETEDALDSIPCQAEQILDLSESRAQGSQNEILPADNDDPCSEFRQLDDLRPEEITISIVGDAAESGLAGNSMLEISARGITRRLALAQFGLVDRRSGELNRQAAVLVGLAHGKKILRSVEKHAATMTRLRSEFRNRLGVKADPFTIDPARINLYAA